MAPYKVKVVKHRDFSPSFFYGSRRDDGSSSSESSSSQSSSDSDDDRHRHHSRRHRHSDPRDRDREMEAVVLAHQERSDRRGGRHRVSRSRRRYERRDSRDDDFYDSAGFRSSRRRSRRDDPDDDEATILAKHPRNLRGLLKASAKTRAFDEAKITGADYVLWLFKSLIASRTGAPAPPRPKFSPEHFAKGWAGGVLGDGVLRGLSLKLRDRRAPLPPNQRGRNRDVHHY